MARRETRQHRQSVVEPPSELDRHRIVLRLRDVPDLLDFRVFGVGLPALHRADQPRNCLVPIEHPLQTITAGTEVANFERRRLVELSLDVERYCTMYGVFR